MKLKICVFLFLTCLSLSAQHSSEYQIREFHDSIGFAKHGWQMDSIISRIDNSDKKPVNEIYKAVISPHDDYKYAAGLYAKTLSGIKANTVVLIGVAHRARNYELQDKLIFGSYDAWEAPYGNVDISPLRDRLLEKIPSESCVVHNDMMQLEHSLEAIVPFLQYQNRKIKILPLLVPYMKFEDMQKFSEMLARALSEIMQEEGLSYGEDLSVVISNDAIHYGSEDWGGSNLAPFGTDETGNRKAHEKDLRIIDETLKDELSEEKIRDFNNYTVQEYNYKEYKWTWCGRYSVPFGLLFANKLNRLINNEDLQGKIIDYRSSLRNEHIPVKDLGMGTTAPSKPTHWVAYLGMAYQ
ncbi:AmmeMemoRadiSam system protein B [Gramella jeungdoensis]|uniref:AmmeMemoRadiSam system protein B n=1 Tax=Gramella jeungdoensis TaxID=708091 RepID=A0ABT0YX25_9FLAO|nr:AmmeMemoRadiSam system protein B [Gramella jeungdoensis]MCM8568012.1 AmmeMemoRadiSam system protein B [Gramella jeungdoensis]